MNSGSSTAGARLRRLVSSPGATLAPGIYDALSARLAQRAGFDLVYASGGSIVRSFGLPDLGLADPGMMAERYRQIVDAVEVPVFADADNGFGNALNATRVVRLYEQAGVAGMHLEDQVYPKRCGHYAGVELVSASEMSDKIKAALEARRSADTVIAARTDAFGELGLSEAIDRAARYAEAGADMIFIEGVRESADMAKIADAIAAPKVLNCGSLSRERRHDGKALAAFGFKILIFPADLQCAAIAGMAECLNTLRERGLGARAPQPAELTERDRLVDLDRWLELASKRHG